MLSLPTVDPMSPNNGVIPVVEYSIVDQSVLVPPRCDNPQAIPFGFNDGSTWKLQSEPTAQAAVTTAIGKSKQQDHIPEDANRYIRYLRKFEAIKKRERVLVSLWPVNWLQRI